MAHEHERGHLPGEPPPLRSPAGSRPGRVLILAAAALLFPPPHRVVLSALLLAFMIVPGRREVWLSLGSAAVLWQIGQERAGPEAGPLRIAVIGAGGLLLVWLAH